MDGVCPMEITGIEISAGIWAGIQLGIWVGTQVGIWVGIWVGTIGATDTPTILMLWASPIGITDFLIMATMDITAIMDTTMEDSGLFHMLMATGVQETQDTEAIHHLLAVGVS